MLPSLRVRTIGDGGEHVNGKPSARWRRHLLPSPLPRHLRWRGVQGPGRVRAPMAAEELKIHVGDLDAGGKQFAFPLRAAWIRGVLEDHEATAAGPDGLLDVRASRSGNDVVVHGTLRADLVVPCARCLAPVPLKIDEPLSLLFVPGKVTPPPLSPKAAAKAASDQRDAKAASHAAHKKRSARRAEPEEIQIPRRKTPIPSPTTARPWSWTTWSATSSSSKRLSFPCARRIARV